MKRVYIGLMFMVFAISCEAYEYLYPVGHSARDGFTLLLLYQKSVHHIELWQWNPVTQVAGKALLSTYTPAGIALLPDDHGFSFIDNDTIRVAYAHKRSPKLIPLYEPLYDFTTMHWFDTQHCILSAKEKERYGIYSVDVEGRCIELLADTTSDFRYPNLIDTTLYYIYVQNDHHTIMQGTIDLVKITTPKKLTPEEIYNTDDQREHCAVEHQMIMVDCNSRHVAFLTMQDQYTGFYLEHPARIDRHDMLITFDYHAITKQDDVWSDVLLFSFSIPTAYLMDPKERLYESILPFLPKIVENIVYYCHCEPLTITTQLWCYDMLTSKQEQITDAHQSVLGVYNKWYGGVLQDDPYALDELPKAWVNNQGQFCVHMPKIKTTN